jgi:hypothetical protein
MEIVFSQFKYSMLIQMSGNGSIDALIPYSITCDYTVLESTFLDYEDSSDYSSYQEEFYYKDYCSIPVEEEIASKYEVVEGVLRKSDVEYDSDSEDSEDSDNDDEEVTIEGMATEEEIDRILSILDNLANHANQEHQESTVFSSYQTMEEDGELLEEGSTDYQRSDEPFYDEHYVEVFDGINSYNYEFMYQLQSVC